MQQKKYDSISNCWSGFYEFSFSEINKNGVFCRNFFSGFSQKCCLHKIFKVVNNFNRVFACNFFPMYKFNKTYMKYTHFLKLLLATIAKG